LIHAVNDAERVGDHSEDLVELGHLTRDGRHSITGDAQNEIRQLQSLLNEQFEAIYLSLERADLEQVDVLVRNEESITELVQACTEAHVRRLESGKCEVQAGVIFLDFMAHLERVGDHLLNIGERAGKILEVTAG
jgi:phosphate:Na+ symporter